MVPKQDATMPDISHAWVITEQAGLGRYRQERMTTRTLKRNRRQGRFLKALEENDCVVLRASQDTGISRQRHYDWLEECPAYAKAVRALEDMLLDKAETVVKNLLELGNSELIAERSLALKAATYLLDNKGKARGYGKPGVAVQVNNQVNNEPAKFEIIVDSEEKARRLKDAMASDRPAD
jgi:hypothetical protein